MGRIRLSYGGFYVDLDTTPPPAPKLCSLCGQVEVSRRGSRCPTCAIQWEAFKAEAREAAKQRVRFKRFAEERKALKAGDDDIVDAEIEEGPRP